ncbi:hypothetical protein HK105_203243 [Polyrhizophydium stewartii]|uniref:Pyridoxamine 5'-phosphate oxidase Alr4036 family FMN-binding domain-containing protein n=1 Tax=Polyrhizophydium stewartii TaxID=2732419 RepID=A0ABR4NCL8_9FUNG
MSSSKTETQWAARLRDAVKRNYSDVAKETVRVAMASVRPDGSPGVHQVVFHEQLRTDSRVLVLSGPARNATLVSTLKGNKTHDLFWSMPKTGETFTITGKVYLVAAPNFSHRFGTPPKRIGVVGNASPDDFWEGERMRWWKALTPFYRATFSWPAPGELRSLSDTASWSVYAEPLVKISTPAHNVGFKYTRLEVIEDATVNNLTIGRNYSIASSGGSLPRNGSATPTRSSVSSVSSAGGPVSPTSTVVATIGDQPQNAADELRWVHNSALDNFCLLVFKPTRVDHVQPIAGKPPTRFVFTVTKEGDWLTEEINP